MKNLLLLRHAKSSWKDDSLNDHERPLKKRGRKDAKRIAKEILENDLIPDIILSSSAVRARETVEVMIENLDSDIETIFSRELYMAEPEEFFEILSTMLNLHQTIMIVGHNPGLEAFLQILGGEIEALPTAGLAHLVLPIDDWCDISFETVGVLAGFWTAKGLEKKDK